MQNRRFSKGAQCILSHYIIIDLPGVQISINDARRQTPQKETS